MKLILLILLLFNYSFADLHNPSSKDPARLTVHLLDYLAQDYSGAIVNGKIVSKSEYQEQIEFAEQVKITIAKIELGNRKLEIQNEANQLYKEILSKSDAKVIQKIARSIQSKVIQLVALEQTPSFWPSITKGKKLYSTNCVACHGESGHGDGPAGVALDPKPTNFFNKVRMNEITAFQTFNAIRLGIPGTGMQPMSTLSDKEVWELSFYLLSLRYQDRKGNSKIETNAETLKLAATATEDSLFKSGNTEDYVRSLRTHEPEEDNSTQFIDFAIASLDDSFTDYKNKSYETAKKKSIMAYLEGVEPIEPKLKAMDPKFTIELEEVMAKFRSDLEHKLEESVLIHSLNNAKQKLEKAKTLITTKQNSIWVTFSLAAGILFREGFEAVLLLIALLGVIRAAKSKKAEFWLHIGWLTAIFIGFVSWFLSGWLTKISGADREVMEAVTSIFAVVILLYLGFWLHSKTEITRWKAFIDGKVKKALDGGSRIGIAIISFIAVFREAFETVLFLRALSIEDSRSNQFALLAGVIIAFIAVFIIGWLFLKYSNKVPIKKLFTISSFLMIVLAIILTGKAIHAFQETAIVSATISPIQLRVDLFGFYPTFETLVGQCAIAIISLLLWKMGKKSPHEKH